MKSNLKCEIVKDLLPSYIEGLTSEVTNKEVKEHLDECKECKEVELLMREDENNNKVENVDKEVDYLKKVKKTNNKKIGITIGICVILLVAVVLGILIKIYIVGNETSVDAIAIKTLSVQGNKITINGNFVDSITGFRRAKVDVKDGVATLNIYSAPVSLFTKNKIYIEEVVDETINTLYIGDKVVYDNRVYIDKEVANVYNNKTPYVGANYKVVSLLKSLDFIGLFDIINTELQTSEEPYGVILNIENIATTESEENMQMNMRAYSCVLMSCIDNLGQVIWKYTKNNEEAQYVYTLEEANKDWATNIKDSAGNASNLQTFMEELDLLDEEENKSTKQYWEQEVEHYEMYGESNW